jgi:hypothetical protein
MDVLFSQLGTARNEGFTIDHGLKDVKIIEKINGSNHQQWIHHEKSWNFPWKKDG